MGSLVLLVAALAVERLILSSRLRQVPLRICVTGTRGKSTVTRLVAAALREEGRRVLGKITGSQPAFVLPDGSEEAVPRRGPASILETKKLLKRASRLRVDALVSELMSIHPECLYTESVQMLAPHVVVLTNVRLDHLDQMGSSPHQIARSLATAIPGNATVFLLEEELSPVFEEESRHKGFRMVPVRRGSYEESHAISSLVFEANIRLALAVAGFCDVGPEVALRGMRSAKQDFGALQVWTADIGRSAHPWYLVSAFAANDPQSTREAIDKVRETVDVSGLRLTGLLNLRSDRGDRTLQWSRALAVEPFWQFDRIFLLGRQAGALLSMHPAPRTNWCVLDAKEPARIMDAIARESGDEALFLVGMGNMGGMGTELVRYWRTIGRAL